MVNDERADAARDVLLKEIADCARGSASASTLRNLAEAYALVTGSVKSVERLEVKSGD